MLALEFEAPGNFIMIGNTHMDAVETKHARAGDSIEKYVLCRMRRPVVDIGIVQDQKPAANPKAD